MSKTVDAFAASDHPHRVMNVRRIYGPPAVVREILDRVRAAGILRCYAHHAAIEEASDAELRRLAGPGARLHAEDVRWDVINASHTGRRHRI